GVRAALARRQLRLVGEATYRRGTTYAQGMRPQVDILRQTEAEAVICVGVYAACAAFIRDARDAGWDVPIANVSFVSSETLLAPPRSTSESNGHDYPQNLITSEVVPNYLGTNLPAIRQYRELMDRYRPMPPRHLLDATYEPLP